MDEVLQDKRFAHMATDPVFRRVPRIKQRTKRDSRFQKLVTDSTLLVDKRGRPIHKSVDERLKNYYDAPSSDEDEDNSDKDEASEVDGDDEEDVPSVEKMTKSKVSSKKRKHISTVKGGSKGKNTDVKKKGISNTGSEKISWEVSDVNDECAHQESPGKKSEIAGSGKKKKKGALDMDIDYARGEAELETSSSSDDSSEESENDIVHDWGEMDRDAPKVEKATSRLAICNMDWDSIRASDLMVSLNSFASGGNVTSVTIFPSEYGLKCMAEENVRGPGLPEEDERHSSSDEEEAWDDEGDPVTSRRDDRAREILRKYQFKRLKYFYAVAVCDSIETAETIYNNCDGLEYEASGCRYDLRFVPDDMDFNDQKAHDVCDEIPSKYEPLQFENTALQMVDKVELTFDAPDQTRQSTFVKANADAEENDDIWTYLASSSEEEPADFEKYRTLLKIADERAKSRRGRGGGALGSDEEDSGADTVEVTWNDEDAVPNENATVSEDVSHDHSDSSDDSDTSISQFHGLVSQTNDDSDGDVDMEATWDPDANERAQKVVERVKGNNLTPFEGQWEKKKIKMQEKREKMKKRVQEACEEQLPKKKKNREISKEEKCSIELNQITMDDGDNSDDNRRNLTKKQKFKQKVKEKRKQKLAKKLGTVENTKYSEAMSDPRFSAVFTSSEFNVDPTNPQGQNSEFIEAIAVEKQKRRKVSTAQIETSVVEPVKTDLSELVTNLKRKLKKK